MGTQVLYPQDYFIAHTPAPFSYQSNHYGYYNNRAVTSRSYRKPVTRLEPKKPVTVSSCKPEPALVKRLSTDDSVTVKSSGSEFEKVVILRRGKSLDSVKIDTYAGSAAFGLSPSPSALPLPSFPMKKQLAVIDDSATRDLRRLLRLD